MVTPRDTRKNMVILHIHSSYILCKQPYFFWWSGSITSPYTGAPFIAFWIKGFKCLKWSGYTFNLDFQFNKTLVMIFVRRILPMKSGLLDHHNIKFREVDATLLGVMINNFNTTYNPEIHDQWILVIGNTIPCLNSNSNHI